MLNVKIAISCYSNISIHVTNGERSCVTSSFSTSFVLECHNNRSSLLNLLYHNHCLYFLSEMSISCSSLSSNPTSFATVSLGTTEDLLPSKLEIISSAGFQAIELGFPDLVSFASSHHKKEIKEDDYTHLCSAGIEVKKLCVHHGLKILMLQSFANFEG